MTRTSAPTLTQALLNEGLKISELTVLSGLSFNVVNAVLAADACVPISRSIRPESVDAIEGVFGYGINWSLPVAYIGKPSGRHDRTHAAEASERWGAQCPTCFQAKSVAGTCDNCD